MADEIPMLSRSTSHGPLPQDEIAILRRIPGLAVTPGPAPKSSADLAHSPTPDATVVLDGTTVRLGPVATAAVLDLLGRLTSGGQVAVSEHDRWLNTSQAARLAGVSNTYLRQLADRGEIPVTYRGTHRRIHPDDVQAWLRRREEARSAAATPDETPDGPGPAGRD